MSTSSPRPPYRRRSLAPAAAIVLASSLLSLCAAPVRSGPQAAPPELPVGPLRPAPAAVMNTHADQVTLKSVAPSPGTTLTLGHPIEFRIIVGYTLASRSVALLGLYIEMFPRQASGCAGEIHRTNGGTYTDLVHGTGTRTIVVRWPGTTTKDVGAPGHLGFGANLWTADRKQEIKTFGVLIPKTYCYSFT
jgi:hypothetical protein